MAQAITLQVYRGDQLISTQTFDRDVIKIGRLPSAQLRLDDLKVARIHAVIEIPSGGKEFFLQDMGSAEGTYLNGEKIKRTKLKDQDQIVVGETRLIVVMGGAAKPAGAPMQQPMMQQPAQPGMQMQPGMQQPMQQQPGMRPQQPMQQQPMQQQRPQQPGMATNPGVQPNMQARPGQPMAQGTQPMQPGTMQPGARPQGMPGQPGAQPMQPGMQPGQQPVFTPGAGPAFQPAGQQPKMPTFDPRTINFSQPIERINSTAMDRAAFDDGAVGLEPEKPVSADNRALELRMYWGDIILDISHLEMPKHAKQITIGETRNTDIFISSEGLPKEEFPLIRHTDGQYVLTFFNDLEGEIQQGGELKSLKDMRSSSRVQKDEEIEGCYKLTMDVGTKAIVHWGGLTMAMRFVPPPQRLTGAPMNIDFQFMNIIVIVLFLMVGSIFSLSLYPYEAEALNEELMKSDNKFAQFILEPPKPPEQQKAAQEFLNKLQEKEAAGPAKAKGDDGKFGKKDTPAADAHSAQKAIKPDDKEVLKNAGIFKALGSGGFSQVIGTNSGLGGDVQNALGNLTGKQAGDAGGLGGLGLKGTGPGGGGIGNSIGLSTGVNTSGRIGGSANYGSDQGKLGQKRETDINLADAPPVVQGSLDPALIKKVIQENRNAIRYCYERELQVKKDLAGIIKTQFIIGPAGQVTMSVVKESSMKNPTVENCIAGKIRGLLFPKPKGGGIVIVNYPFVFKSAGGG